ncbi:hypothetical protein GCM10010327_39860 [Streptomyces nitrosporeus]|nr:hypothetical protein GCM10010327_39860 [Streptomyces nitrosporeus]
MPTISPEKPFAVVDPDARLGGARFEASSRDGGVEYGRPARQRAPAAVQDPVVVVGSASVQEEPRVRAGQGVRQPAGAPRAERRIADGPVPAPGDEVRADRGVERRAGPQAVGGRAAAPLPPPGSRTRGS